MSKEKKKKNKFKGFFTDFKNFITKGNILDLAIAVIIGGAFGKIVTSLVNDIIMPLITLAVGGVSVADWKWVIKSAQYDSAGILTRAETSLNYGNFLQSTLDFFIIAFFVFLMLKIVINLNKRLSSGLDSEALLRDQANAEYVAELKAQGKKRGEIKALLQARKADQAAAQTAAAELNKPETTEKILSDIRTLLQENNSPKKTETKKE